MIDVEDVKLEPNQSVIAWMDHTGDTKLIWSRDNSDEVENARRTFKDLKKKGFVAYKVTGKDGSRGEVIDEFDPHAERVILAPPMVGG